MTGNSVIFHIYSFKASSTFLDPIVQFLCLVAPKRYTPLQLTDYSGKLLNENAYIIPRWGGVSIVNSNSSNLLLDETNSHKIMEIFIYQLRVLLGIPKDKIQTTWVLLIFTHSQ
jgi:GPI-anchor transamidase subunit S